MWIVQLALRRPYTFVVMAILIVLLGGLSVLKTPTDILPEIDIPVVSVIWSYSGMAADEMEKRITTFSEFAISSTVNDVKNIESQTLNGVGVIRVYFHPNVKIDTAIAQITASAQAIRVRMPPGVQPPTILRFNASSVPILQLSLSSKTLSEAEVYNYGIYRIRQQLAVVQGTTLPAPYGGKVRQVQVDLDPDALVAKGLAPNDVVNAINAQNLTLPTGNARIGTRDYTVSLNSSPETIDAFNDVPIKAVNGTMIYLRDVAHTRDGFAVQTNVVRQGGQRGALVTILKSGGASTLDIVNQVKALMPQIKAQAPPGLDVELLFDQSIFVRAAISGVVKESVIAALLTAAMILVFLGSWRSTLIVTVSIPLSILSSIIVLSALGETLNVMTLGGLALAVGLLVDDATVEIENIHRNLAQGKPLKQAILDGAQQIAVPAFVSTLTICIVFVSVLFLTGPAKYLFTPLGYAVVFAMGASYFLSRTLVPTLVNYLLPAEAAAHAPRETNGEPDAASHGATGLFGRAHESFDRAFEATRARYSAALSWALAHRRIVFASFLAIVASTAVLVPFVGQDFFPDTDAGQFRLHVRAPSGTRIEETEQLFAQVEDEIRKTIPAHEVALILDNIGVPSVPFNLAFGDSSTVGSSDGEILVSLHEDHHPTAGYTKALRTRLASRFPQATFYFQPADIVSQILNFGLAAPIDVQVMGYDKAKNYQVASRIAHDLARIPGIVDTHVHQIVDAPDIRVKVDRTRAGELGLTQSDVANDLLVSLSGTTQVSPNYWVDPTFGMPYLVGVQTPPHSIDSVDAIGNTSLAAGVLRDTELLSNVATFERRTTTAVANHSNVQPVFDVYANVQGRDLGSAARAIDKVLADARKQLPGGSSIRVRGQVESMSAAFTRLGAGLVFAALLVYFLMVVNFQSWTDPFVIITALPGALVGIVWMLFATGTTFSVPSLMGAIMSVGVATANSILLVTFANDQREHGLDATAAALSAGSTRLRPVLMTAFAMIIGMVPMSLGLGEGGEQNAPLGRAVIGGLIVATAATLFFVPVVYSVLRRTPRSPAP